MPFKSKAQQRYLFAKEPEFAEHTPKASYKKLTENVSKDKNGLKDYTKKHGRKSNAR